MTAQTLLGYVNWGNLRNHGDARFKTGVWFMQNKAMPLARTTDISEATIALFIRNADMGDRVHACNAVLGAVNLDDRDVASKCESLDFFHSENFCDGTTLALFRQGEHIKIRVPEFWEDAANARAAALRCEVRWRPGCHLTGDLDYEDSHAVRFVVAATLAHASHMLVLDLDEARTTTTLRYVFDMTDEKFAMKGERERLRDALLAENPQAMLRYVTLKS